MFSPKEFKLFGNVISEDRSFYRIAVNLGIKHFSTTLTSMSMSEKTTTCKIALKTYSSQMFTVIFFDFFFAKLKSNLERKKQCGFHLSRD